MRKILIFISTVCLFSCSKINVFEKTVPLKLQHWNAADKPVINFSISNEDTLSRFNIYLVFRHTDAYNFNNLWLNIYTKGPIDSALKKQQVNVSLAAADNSAWLGSGMDDIYEHRIRITEAPVKFSHPGNYSFTLEQIMREDPLQHVLNVGIRIEKAN